jgi:Rrf2 family protein
MRISTKGRYSLEALLYLALLPAGESASTRDIAAHTDISERYLEQLFIALRKKRLIQGTRGARGGYTLGKAGASITVGDILRAADVALDLVWCAAEGSEHASESCPRLETCGSRHTWSALYNAINSFADSVTLGDLAEACRVMDAPEYAI